MPQKLGGWLTAALIVAGALIPSPCRATFEDDMRQALAALRNKDFERAKNCFTDAIQSNPNSADAFTGRALVCMQMGLFSHAIDDLDKALQLNPHVSHCVCMRGACRQQLADYDGAIADQTESIRLDATQSQAFSSRGACYLHKFEYAKAVADLSEAIRLNPTWTPSVLNRAAAYFFLKDYALALADCDEVIAGGQKDLMKDAYRFRGQIRRMSKEYDKALADFQSSLEIDHNDGLVYACLAYLRATSSDPKMRDGAKAVEYARKACDLTGRKSAFCLMALAAALAEVGDFDGAVQQLQSSMDCPGNCDPWQREEASRQMKLYKVGKPYHDE